MKIYFFILLSIYIYNRLDIKKIYKKIYENINEFLDFDIFYLFIFF